MPKVTQVGSGRARIGPRIRPPTFMQLKQQPGNDGLMPVSGHLCRDHSSWTPAQDVVDEGNEEDRKRRLTLRKKKVLMKRQVILGNSH